MAVEPAFIWNGWGTGGTAIVLPGIQSYAKGQALGLYPVLRTRHKHVIGFDYNTGPFKPQQLAVELAEHVAYWQRNSGAVTLVGLSFGAPLAVLVTAEMRKLRDRQLAENKLPLGQIVSVADPAKYRVVMIDPPFGAVTMKQIPDWFALVAGPVLAAASWLVPSAFTLDSQARFASEDSFTLPSQTDLVAMFPNSGTRLNYTRLVRQADLENQQGHSLRTWLQQVAWLASSATKVPFSAMKGVWADLVTADSPHNTVVRSGLAAAAWKRVVHFNRLANVDAEHCATLRDQPAYSKALCGIFDVAYRP